VFKANVVALGIDLKTIDIAVVSHAHFDHLNGIDYLLEVNPQVKIYFPEDIFWGSPCPFDATGQDAHAAEQLPKHMQYFDGGPTKFVINQSGRFWKANIEFIKNVTEIIPGVTLIPTASQYLGYFSKYPNKSFAPGTFDDSSASSEAKLSKLQELSLVLSMPEGDTVMVGCSHSSIDIILEAVVAATQRPIGLLAGGMHLLPFDQVQLQTIIDHMKNKIGVKKVAPTHCTGHLAFKMLQEVYGHDYLYLGLGETVQF
jgi:7,8-dihydropterin-6-yl-methyl-4-(beta-D-ribofuranosyl)aminobenzene 5'-phosphate synthase